MARGGAEILISPQPDGRTTLMSLIPVGEDERTRIDREKVSYSIENSHSSPFFLILEE